MNKEIYKMTIKSSIALMVTLFVMMSCKNSYLVMWEATLSSMENMLMILSSIILYLSQSYSTFTDTAESKTKSSFMGFLVIVSCSISFFMANKFFFFLMFEISMIPMFISIIALSKESSKMYSAMIMMLMNMALAIPTLIFILVEFKELKTFNTLTSAYSGFMYLNVTLSMLVVLMMMSKAPMFFMHMWLPKAHVDSFTLGSVILAGLMIKLSVVGLIKLSSSLMEISSELMWIVLSISWTTVIISLIMMIRSVDIKKMAATSSIAHMGLALNSILSMKSMGMMSSVMILFSHGLVASMMFSIIGLMYESSEGRSLFSNKSMESLSKTLTMMWVMILFLNVGIPPTLTFFGELLTMVNFFLMDSSSVVFMAVSMIMISSASMLSMTKLNFMKKEKMSMSIKNGNLSFTLIFLLFLVFNLLTIPMF